jgi:hypothetical protein
VTSRGAGAACALVALLVPAMAGAAEWSLQTDAQLHALAQSNPQLIAGGKNGAQAGVVDASMDLTRRTGLLDLDVLAHASMHRYQGNQGLDRNDQKLAMALARRGETWILRGNASYTRDTTLTSELGTTGNTGFNREHRARGLSMAPLWQLSERSSAGITLGWQDNTYARGAEVGLSDYNYLSVAFNGSHAVSETTSASLVLSAGRLDSALYAFATDNMDARLELEHAWSPRWRGSIAGGPSMVRADGRRTTGSLFNASLERQSERFTLALTLGRRNSPNGSGLLSRRDQLAINASLPLSAQVNAVAGVSMVRSRDLVPRAGFTLNDVRYGRADLSLSWGFARNWNLAVGAGAATQEIAGIGARGSNVDARVVLAWRRQEPLG